MKLKFIGLHAKPFAYQCCTQANAIVCTYAIFITFLFCLQEKNIAFENLIVYLDGHELGRVTGKRRVAASLCALGVSVGYTVHIMPLS